ncbi:MAG: DUF3604 domain-containing protein [Candidatus Lokiarchaeota archaeon]|nr:DUF3604 domain-containing protein [Candidatus Lokiarchaeota archaeon]
MEVNPQHVTVRKKCSISVKFTLDIDLPKNSFIIFRFRGGRNNKNDWYFLQPYDANKNGFFELDLQIRKKLIPITITGKELLIKYLILDSDGIEKETEINLILKDTLAQSIVEKNKKIEVLIKNPGKAEIILENSPTIQVVSEEFDHINIIAPSIINLNEAFNCILRFEDRFNNLIKNFSGHIKVICKEDKMETQHFCIDKLINEKNEVLVRLSDLKINNSGVYYLEVLYNKISYISNPILSKSDQDFNLKLYWGYIHGHTNKSDGMRTVYEYFENLIKSGLDFGTSTEHDRLYETSNEDFEEIKLLIEKYNNRNDFASLFGYEYGTWYTGYGDICIYHYSYKIPIFRSEINKYNSTPKLIKNLLPYENKVLMIGHHTALRPGYRNWEYFEESLEKLVEIYSTWGNQEYAYSEGNPIPPRYKFFGYGRYARKRGAILGKKGCYVADALQRGYKLGFVAGGDDHVGVFPSGNVDLDNGIYPSGIMAIWANELNREDLWAALKNRKCFGTTGPRVILKFSVNNSFMGDIVPLDDNKELKRERIIKLKIISPLKIKKIEIIRNNTIFCRKIFKSNSLELKLSDREDFEDICVDHSGKKEKFLFYYPRIFMADANMAWASPIWIIKN